MLSKKDRQLITDIISNSNSGLEEKIGKKISDLKNDIYKFKDEILKEIADLRDDITVTEGNCLSIIQPA